MREAGDGPALSRFGDRPSLEPLLEGGRPWGGQAAGRPRPASRGWCLTTASRAAHPAQHRTPALLSTPETKAAALPGRSCLQAKLSPVSAAPLRPACGPRPVRPPAGKALFALSPGAVSPPPGSPHRGFCSLSSLLQPWLHFLSLVLRFMSTWWLGQGPMCWVSSSPGQRAGPEAEGHWVKQAGDAHPQGWALGLQGQPHPQRPL